KLRGAMGRGRGERSLCRAGGVALIGVATGKLPRRGVFARLWIQPAAGDAGGAIGAALTAYHLHLRHDRVVDAATQDGMGGGYLGPEDGPSDIEQRVASGWAGFEAPAGGAFRDSCGPGPEPGQGAGG